MLEQTIGYVAIGILYVWLEHNTFEFDFSEFTRKDIIITVLQQVIHYLRVALMWPLYVLEDMLIFYDNHTSDPE